MTTPRFLTLLLVSNLAFWSWVLTFNLSSLATKKPLRSHLTASVSCHIIRNNCIYILECISWSQNLTVMFLPSPETSCDVKWFFITRKRILQLSIFSCLLKYSKPVDALQLTSAHFPFENGPSCCYGHTSGVWYLFYRINSLILLQSHSWLPFFQMKESLCF